MRRYRLVGLLVAVSCLASACAEETDLTVARVLKASPSPVSGELGAPGGATGSEATPQPTASPETQAVALDIAPLTASLALPPLDGTPLYPASIRLAASRDGQAVTPRWESSDPRIAEVDAQGLVSALRAGRVTITARLDGREAATTVTVEARGRLAVTATNAPTDTTRIVARVLDASGAILAQGTGPFDLPSAGGLTVEAEARSAGDTLLGLGRWEGVSLYANQVNERSIPLNVPQLTGNTGNGGPGSTLTIHGSGFEGWKKGQGGSLTIWNPVLKATVGGQEAWASASNDALASITVPALAGSPAIRPLTLVVGGVPLTSSFRLLGTLGVASPPATMSVGAVVRFQATAADTDGFAVVLPNVTWDLQGAGMGEPVLGTMEPGGSFEAERPGVATIVARSGTLSATTTVTIVP